MMYAGFIGALFFATAAMVGVLAGNTLVERIERFTDGPQPWHPPLWALVGSCAVIGAIVTARTSDPVQLLLIACVCAALCAAFITDAKRGVVPDVLSVGPLAAMLLGALWQHQWWVFVSAAIPFAPFAIAAALSRGKGMGWGDAKLAALAGAFLGPSAATLSLGIACAAAVAVRYATRKTREPLALAPYLVSAVGVAVPIAMMR
ncbi:MAG: prepilin peptidase [Candidatus Eremiobacteraeota bacterium]|nr:prepilin peptidase [Candidatus Eremiobacteraeota bacterium]